MAVTVIANGANTKQTQLVAKQAEVTALSTQSATTGPGQTSQRDLYKQKGEELVRGCEDCERLNAAAIISTFSSFFTSAWLAKYAPRIAVLTASITANPATAAACQSELLSEQIRAVDNAMAQGLGANANVLATLT